jgi:hypothetical protein
MNNARRGGSYSLLSEAIQALPDIHVQRLCFHDANHESAMKRTVKLLIDNGADKARLSEAGEYCIATAALRGNTAVLT